MAHRHQHSAHHAQAEQFRTSRQTTRALNLTVGICAAVTLLGLILLWPRGDYETDTLSLTTATVDAHVNSIVEQPCSYAETEMCRLVTLNVTSGARSGEVFVLEQPASSGRRMETGDDVIASADESTDRTVRYSFYDFQRSTPLVLLTMIFAVAIIALGRWRGVGALAGLVASLLVLTVFMLPSLLAGNNAVLVALVSASLIAFIALYLAHGINPATTVALVSTFAALAVTGALAWIFVYATKFTGFADESAQFLDALQVPVDPRGILLAGIVIGSLGVLDDVTVTQVSAVWELHHAQPELSSRNLYSAALRIGRDHISSTVNTLFLAYAGAALPLMLLFTQSGRSFNSIATSEVVAVEIVRSLVGSIGLVSAVPITTWLAARVLRPPRPRSSGHADGVAGVGSADAPA